MITIEGLAATTAAKNEKNRAQWRALWQPRVREQLTVLKDKAQRVASCGHALTHSTLVVGRPLDSQDTSAEAMRRDLRDSNWTQMNVAHYFAQHDGRNIILKLVADEMKGLNLSFPINDFVLPPSTSTTRQKFVLGTGVPEGIEKLRKLQDLKDGIYVSSFAMTDTGYHDTLIHRGHLNSDQSPRYFNIHCVNGFYTIYLFWHNMSSNYFRKRTREQAEKADKADKADKAREAGEAGECRVKVEAVEGQPVVHLASE